MLGEGTRWLDSTTSPYVQNNDLGRSSVGVRARRRLCRIFDGRILANVGRHLLERFELAFAHQIKLADEVVEMFVAGIDVGLGANGHQSVEVMDVDVDEDAEQTR